MVKEVKAFRPYLVGGTIIAYVSNVVVKDVFIQIEVTGRRCRWINRIQEFDIEIQITKLVRGQGLTKLMAESNLEASHYRRGGFATHNLSSFREPHRVNCPQLPRELAVKVLESERVGHKDFLDRLTSSWQKDVSAGNKRYHDTMASQSVLVSRTDQRPKNEFITKNS